MKKKLVSVLLILSLCTALAIPVFAGPAEEPPIPEETTPLEIIAPKGGEEDNALDLEFYQQVMAMVDELDIELDVDEEGIEPDMDFYQQVMALVDELDIEIDADVMDAENSNSHICVAEYDEEKDYIGLAYKKINGDKEQHKVYKTYMGHCVDCKNPIVAAIMLGTENHSFRKGSLDSCRQGDANGHEVRYPYACWKCEMTIMGPWETESHSLKKMDYTGNNYHRGALHYLEWTWSCTKCGYTETRWESRSCPGNNDGTGCNFPINRIAPPVEVQDVTGPEEVQSLEGAELEEVTEPEESILPEETT